jgi:hypothetical protein
MTHFRREILWATKESAIRLSVSRTAKICPIEIAANISRPPLHLALPVKQHNFTSDHIPRNYNLLFPAAFTLAHRALAAAEMAALPAALIFRLGF